MHEKKYYLIEALATVIADEILKKFDGIDKLVVKLRKRSVPVGGVIDYVEAVVEKAKGE